MNVHVEDDVLAWLDDASAARQLLSHPHNRLLVANGHGYQILNEATGTFVRLRGLTTPLAECFWSVASSSSSWSRWRKRTAAKGRRRPSSTTATLPRRRRKNPSSTTTTTTGAVPTWQNAIRGRARGSVVHRQIQDLIQLDATMFHRRNAHGSHPWVEQVCRAFVETMCWRPLVTEFLVGDMDLGVGTEIDSVWVAKDGTLHFIELKTGYNDDREWYYENGPMHGELGKVLGDSPVNRAIVQCIAGTILAIETLQIKGNFACWAVRVNDRGTDLVPVTTEVLHAIAPIIRQTLASHQARRRRQMSKEQHGDDSNNNSSSSNINDDAKKKKRRVRTADDKTQR